MKTKRLLLFPAALLVLILTGLAACTDHLTLPTTPGSTTSRLRVKTLTLDLPNDVQKVSLFRYDEQSRLSSIVTYQTPDSTVAPVEYSTYQYDGQNRLAQLRREVVLRPAGSSPNPVEQYDYRYNAAGQVEGVSYPTSGGYSMSFRYDGSGQLAGNSEFSSNPIAGISYSEGNQFTFTGSNLTSVNTTTRTVFRGPTLETTSTTIFTHDNKRNPFYGIYIIPAPYIGGFGFSPSFGNYFYYTYSGGFGNLLNLSTNNVLTSNTPTSYQYTYNAADLPTTRQTTVSGAVTETLRFEYESY